MITNYNTVQLQKKETLVYLPKMIGISINL